MRAPRRLPGQHQRDVDVPRALGPLRPAVARRQRDRARRGRRAGARRAAAACRTRSTGSSSSRSRPSRGSRAASPTNVIPDRAECHLNFRYAPGRTPGGGRGAAGRAVRGPRRAADRRERALRPRRGRAGRRRAGRRGRARARAQAGLDAGGGVRAGGARRGQLRPGRARPGAPPRRVGRDRRARARLRGAGAVRGMRLAPALTGMGTYPFVRLAEEKQRLLAAGVDLIDFGMGEPREETPAFIREALAAAVGPLSTYPHGGGAARAARGGRGVGPAALRHRPEPGDADPPHARVQGGDLPPRAGARREPRGGRRRPAYPVYERAAAFAGREVVELPLAEEHGFLPDLDAVPDSTWRESAVLWLNYPNNPTAAIASLELLRARRRAGARARLRRRLRRGLLRDLLRRRRRRSRPCSCADLRNVAVFNTLSKRSSMPGYRSGFVAGDPELITAAQALPAERRRRAAGLRPARGDRGLGRRGARRGRAGHLPRQARRAAARARGPRAAQRGRRRDVLPLARRRPAGRPAGRAAARGRDRRSRRAPSSATAGRGYLRLALVPTLAECERAAERLDALLD